MTEKVNKAILAIFLLSAFIGCSQEDAKTQQSSAPAVPDVAVNEDELFEVILKEVDRVAGKRFQSMQMEAMASASYQFDGPIASIVDVVEPIAKKAGYVAIDEAESEQTLAEGQRQMQEMTGMELKMLDQKMYQHENGNVISISRTDISGDMAAIQLDMQLLAIQMMNPRKMAEVGSVMKSRETQ